MRYLFFKNFFFIHIKKTDSYGEDGNFDAKVHEIEVVDALMPRILALGPESIIVTGDHSTVFNNAVPDERPAVVPPPPAPVVVILADKDAGPATVAPVTTVATDRYLVATGLTVATVTASDSKAPDRTVGDRMISKNTDPAS